MLANFSRNDKIKKENWKEVEILIRGLREKRIAQGMTQTEVALKCDVTLMTYQLWERGVGDPNEQNKKKLEAVFGILD
jgi:transcriptional regulator with XRE-family HTH domain